MNRQSSGRRLIFKAVTMFGMILMLSGIGRIPAVSYADEQEAGYLQGEEKNDQPDDQVGEVRSSEEDDVLTYVTVTVEYRLEGHQEPPERTMIEIEDERTGERLERQVSLLEIQEERAVWEKSFTFPITVTGYDSEAFMLDDVEIPADADLTAYGDDFLRYLEIPEDCYTIDTIQWDGESYLEDGVVCRKAIAYGAKLVREVEVMYGGQVRLPMTEAEPEMERDIITLPEPEESERLEEIASTEVNDFAEEEHPLEREMEHDAESELRSLFDRIRDIVREHLVVVSIGITFLLGILGYLLLMRYAGNRRNPTDNKMSAEHSDTY